MSSPGDVVLATLTDPTFGIPMVLLVATIIGWALWSRPAAPPALLPYRYRRAWMDTAEASVATGLSRGLFRPAMAFLYGRLMAVLSETYQFPVERFDALFGPRSLEGIPAPEAVRTLVNRFRDVYRRLSAAEGPFSGGFWATLLRPSRIRRLRASVERFIPEYESVLATLERNP